MLVTTINIDIQDIVENALADGIIKNRASWGCAVVMEVKTGKVKAIANLHYDSINNKMREGIAFLESHRTISTMADAKPQYVEFGSTRSGSKNFHKHNTYRHHLGKFYVYDLDSFQVNNLCNYSSLSTSLNATSTTSLSNGPPVLLAI